MLDSITVSFFHWPVFSHRTEERIEKRIIVRKTRICNGAIRTMHQETEQVGQSKELKQIPVVTGALPQHLNRAGRTPKAISTPIRHNLK